MPSKRVADLRGEVAVARDRAEHPSQILGVLYRPLARLAAALVENGLGQAVEIRVDLLQLVGAVVDNGFEQGDEGAWAICRAAVLDDVRVMQILAWLERHVAHRQNIVLGQHEAERRGLRDAACRPDEHRHAHVQEILVAVESARRLDRRQALERRHLEAEDPLEEDDLLRLGPHGVDPVHLGRKRRRVEADLDFAFGDRRVKSQHQSSHRKQDRKSRRARKRPPCDRCGATQSDRMRRGAQAS